VTPSSLVIPPPPPRAHHLFCCADFPWYSCSMTWGEYTVFLRESLFSGLFKEKNDDIMCFVDGKYQEMGARETHESGTEGKKGKRGKKGKKKAVPKVIRLLWESCETGDASKVAKILRYLTAPSSSSSSRPPHWQGAEKRRRECWGTDGAALCL